MKPDEYVRFFEVARTHWWFLGTREIIADFVARAIHGVEDPRILDVGCGAGNVLESLASCGRGYGIDREPGALAVCAAHTRSRLARAEATSLPFADESFDVVVATDIFEHVRDDVAAVHECHRVTRRGGTVVAAAPAVPLLYGPHDVALEHHRRYTKRSFRDLFVNAGFEIVRVTGLNTFLLPPIAAVRLAERVLVREPSGYEIDYGARGSTGAVNRLLLGILRFERAWLRRRDLPAGVSVLVCGRRMA